MNDTFCVCVVITYNDNNSETDKKISNEEKNPLNVGPFICYISILFMGSQKS